MRSRLDLDAVVGAVITTITIRVVHDKPGVVNHAMTRLRVIVQMLFESINVSAWEETK